VNKDLLPKEGENHQEYSARMRRQEDDKLEAMDPLARNIARVDAELKRRMDTMKYNCFATPEDAMIVRELSQALAIMVEMKTMLGDD